MYSQTNFDIKNVHEIQVVNPADFALTWTAPATDRPHVDDKHGRRTASAGRGAAVADAGCRPRNHGVRCRRSLSEKWSHGLHPDRLRERDASLCLDSPLADSTTVDGLQSLSSRSLLVCTVQ